MFLPVQPFASLSVTLARFVCSVLGMRLMIRLLFMSLFAGGADGSNTDRQMNWTAGERLGPAAARLSICLSVRLVMTVLA